MAYVPSMSLNFYLCILHARSEYSDTRNYVAKMIYLLVHTDLVLFCTCEYYKRTALTIVGAAGYLTNKTQEPYHHIYCNIAH